MTELKLTQKDNALTKEEWEAQRTQAWRDAWISLINTSEPDLLNGLFVGITGDASVFPILFARYDFEEILGDDYDDEKELNFREVWNKLNDTGKLKLIATQHKPEEVSIQKVEELDNKFSRCMNLDEKFREEEEFEEEIDDDDD